MEKLTLDKRGQSSVADALFFFSIASILALFLFVFATNYGATIRTQTEKEQFREYASSALKTILYSSTPRNQSQSLDDSPAPSEVDFLLAAAKEDFADDGMFDETADTLKNTIRGIMQPLSTSADYIFFIYMSDQTNQVPYFLFYRSINNVDKDGVLLTNCPPDASGVTPRGCHAFYYCAPDTLTGVDNFLLSLPNYSRTSVKASFLNASPIPGIAPTKIESEVHFVVWPSLIFADQLGTPYSGLGYCCDPRIDIGNPLEPCHSGVFQPQAGRSSGVSLSIVPSKVHFLLNDTTAKTVNFVVRNKGDTPINSIQIAEQTTKCGDNYFFPKPPFNPVPLDPAIAASKEDLCPSSGSADPLLLSYYTVGSKGEDLKLQDHLSEICSLYSGASPTTEIPLYKISEFSVQVSNIPHSFQLCQFKLTYDGKDRFGYQLTILSEK